MTHRHRLALIFLVVAGLAARVSAESWWDNHYVYRRPVEVNLDGVGADSQPLAQIQFYTAGHINPTGDDIRVATADGLPVPSKVLAVGPGDLVRVVFTPAKAVKKYYVYFGNPAPTPLPKTVDEVKFDCGLLLETRVWTGGATNSPDTMKASFDRSQPVLGQIMIDRPFYGLMPFGEQPQTISKYSGELAIPVDGDYTLAMAADSRGALFIDGAAVVYAPNCPADIRYNKKINLKKGGHPFVAYQVHDGGDPRIAVGWRTPDMDKVDLIPREAFGVCLPATAGALEGFQKRITADFSVDYLGECFGGGNYSHRLRFTANLPNEGKPTVEWDFGDDLGGSDPKLEHVYITPGVYPVRITLKLGNFTDVQTSRISVNRDLQQLDKPPTDPPIVQSKIVAGYDVGKMPLKWLTWATLLHLRAEQETPMLAVAARLAAEKTHPDANHAYTTLQQTTENCIAGPLSAKALNLWDVVPADSDLQPRASRYHAQLLLWWAADFDKAVSVLEPYAAKAKDDHSLQRAYGEALILDQKVEQGRRILLALPEQDDPHRRVAISGAMARSIEYFIEDGDWETGEETWERWEGKYPEVFLEGYSVLLRTRLMELKKAPVAAAKVAEAFATAIPNSSYSPTLLDRASKLLAGSDPEKSKALREELKKRYPEDPLSQN